MSSNHTDVNRPAGGEGSPQADAPLNLARARKHAEAYLLKLANQPDKYLSNRTVSWARLQNAYRTLGMPRSAENSEFIRTWRAKGPIFPFYEQYLIHAGRVQEVITDKALAEEIVFDFTDAWSLRLYRHATQDPAIATMVRDESRRMEDERMQRNPAVRLWSFVRTVDRTICILVVAWLGLAVAAYLQLLNFHLTLGALLGGYVLVLLLL